MATTFPNDAGADPLLRPVLVILVAGVLLGLGQNFLIGLGAPAKALPWIAQEKKLDDLEAVAPAGASSAEASSEPLPEIPDLGRPLQIQLPAVKRFFDADAAVIVDAREKDEYETGHIRGAVHLPYEQVITDPARLEAFDAQGKPIIIYCGGGTCEVSMNLAFALIQAGKSRLLVFMGGYPEWEAAGYPIAKGGAPGGDAK